MRDAGIVHQDIGPPELVANRGRNSLRRLLARYVTDDFERRQTVRGARLHIVQDQRIAARRKHFRRTQADPLRRSSHNCDLRHGGIVPSQESGQTPAALPI